MSTTIKGLKPRLALRERDYRTGSYPTVARVGDDSRFGTTISSYNDINSIIFRNENINLALGLPNSSVFTNSNIQTDIVASGSIVKGVPDNFISVKKVENSITPFDESFRPEQSDNSSFYLTGTNLPEAKLILDQKLSSKTSINLEFSVDTSYIMPANTASIAYFNVDNGTFDLAGGSDATTEPRTGIGWIGARDSKLFHPFGIPIASRSFTAFVGSINDADIIGTVMRYYQEESVTLNSNFSADSSQLILMNNIIDQPFLIEKAVIQLPISCSSEWLNDTTVTVKDSDQNIHDTGGPCVTVCLLNQVSDTKRDIILSASIVPIGDTGSFAYTDPSSGLTFPAGFKSFGGVSAAVVENEGEQVVDLQARSSIYNGLVAATGSNITLVSPFGRGMNPREINGRSFLFKDYSFNSEVVEHNILDTDGQVSFIESRIDSPYLVYPNDKLIFAVSKHRAVRSDINDPVSNDLTASHGFAISQGNIKIKLYGSLIRENREFHNSLNQNLTSNAVHEIIGAEPVIDQFDVDEKGIFSGSYISEYYTGSIFADAFSALPNVEDGVGVLDGRRGRRASMIGTSNIVRDNIPLHTAGTPLYLNKRESRTGFNRNVFIFDIDSIYYDSLIPNPSELMAETGGDILGSNSPTAGFRSAIFVIGRQTTFGWGSPGITSSLDWDFLFPFETRFSQILRTRFPFKNVISTSDLSGDPEINNKPGIVVARPWSAGQDSQNLGSGDATNMLHLGYLPRSGGATATSYLKNLEDKLAALSLFGIGDGAYGEPTWQGMLEDSFPAETTVSHGEIIVRGFKYGLINANNEYKKYSFRRDRFGQLRDLLEQSRDSRFFDATLGKLQDSPVEVRFIGSDGSVTNGEETFSSNVSQFGTSSIPFFDDNAGRNRGNLPSTTIVV